MLYSLTCESVTMRDCGTGVTSRHGFVILSDQYISSQSKDILTEILVLWKKLENAKEKMKFQEEQFQRYVPRQDLTKLDGLKVYQQYFKAKGELEQAQYDYTKTLKTYHVTSIRDF